MRGCALRLQGIDLDATEETKFAIMGNHPSVRDQPEVAAETARPAAMGKLPPPT